MDNTSKAVGFVKRIIEEEGIDASHDWSHIERVWINAKQIAMNENVEEEIMEIIQLAAILHDVDDEKYNTKSNKVEEFLKEINYEHINLILNVIEGVSYSKEKKRLLEEKEEEKETDENNTSSPNKKKRKISDDENKKLILSIVQDADRLDAIGAIGIARCFSYGAVKGRNLYDKDSNLVNDVKSGSNSTLAHFFDKLFKIKDLMKTASGKKIAEKRHEFMKVYVQELLLEINPDIDVNKCFSLYEDAKILALA